MTTRDEPPHDAAGCVRPKGSKARRAPERARSAAPAPYGSFPPHLQRLFASLEERFGAVANDNFVDEQDAATWVHRPVQGGAVRASTRGTVPTERGLGAARDVGVEVEERTRRYPPELAPRILMEAAARAEVAPHADHDSPTARYPAQPRADAPAVPAPLAASPVVGGLLVLACAAMLAASVWLIVQRATVRVQPGHVIPAPTAAAHLGADVAAAPVIVAPPAP